ncbi:hypothetical protein NHX12_024864 [Muraenolepis orangiensis]|uniref:Uncharacterized protein n=1 Tax=Muraenolepis orangiensis TaxID=630683 RepID=A0A9Q0IRR0_9TELE|nr:hypothetical protein NHX12_024864 [Muraenolepis orangiensis]
MLVHGWSVWDNLGMYLSAPHGSQLAPTPGPPLWSHRNAFNANGYAKRAASSCSAAKPGLQRPEPPAQRLPALQQPVALLHQALQQHAAGDGSWMAGGKRTLSDERDVVFLRTR